MSRERAAMPFGDMANLKPRPVSNVVPTEEIEAMARQAGFVTRHAEPSQPIEAMPAAKPVGKVKPVDGRKIRKSKKTAQLNIAVAPEDKNRFWELADELDLDSGGDILSYLINRYHETK